MSRTKEKGKRPDYQDSLEDLLGTSVVVNSSRDQSEEKEKLDLDILDNNEPIERRPKRLGLIESNLLNVSELFKNSENSKTNPQDIIDDLKLISSDDNFDERLEEEIKETQEKMKLQINQYINCTSWEKGFPWDEEIEKVNHDVFHNYSFKNCQREIINAVKA